MSKQNGWKFYAAAPPIEERADRPDHKPSFDTTTLGLPLQDHPCVLMLGNEGTGLSKMLLKRANYLLNIVGDRSRQGNIDSLNVSVAAGLLFEAFRPTVTKIMEKDLF